MCSGAASDILREAMREDVLDGRRRQADSAIRAPCPPPEKLEPLK